MDEVRVTRAVAALLQVFLDDAPEAHYGYDLMRETGFSSGKLYSILVRLEVAGWLVKEHEQSDPAAPGHLARRLYQLNSGGVLAARRALAAVQLGRGPLAP